MLKEIQKYELNHVYTSLKTFIKFPNNILNFDL